MGRIDDPFSMKFILPEHATALLELAFEETLVRQPVLEYDEIAEINYRMTDSRRYGIPVTLRYWRPVGNRRELGEILSVTGAVGATDPVRREVRINEEGGVWTWVSVKRIVGVE